MFEQTFNPAEENVLHNQQDVCGGFLNLILSFSSVAAICHVETDTAAHSVGIFLAFLQSNVILEFPRNTVLSLLVNSHC